MDVKLFAILGIVILVSVPSASAQHVIGAEVKEQLLGIFASSEFTSGPLQKLVAIWENAGSVPCRMRVRTDYRNASNGELAYTAWSAEKPVLPGGIADFVSYADLEPGRYEYRVRVYGCNEIFEKDIQNTSFEVKSREKAESLEIIAAETFDEFIRVSVKSKKDVEGVVVFSSAFPLGWILEHGIIERISEGETKSIDIPYEPSVFKDTQVEIEAASLDGEAAVKKKLLLHKKTFNYMRIVVFIIMVSLAIAIIMLIRRTR